MRAYAAADEETLRVRRLLKDWTGEGLLSDEQRQLMERDTECGLRRTNGILRAVLFLFTAISVAAATWLFFVVFFSGSLSSQQQGAVMLIVAVIVYAGAEAAVSQARLYRHGIEEALAVLSVVFLCAGLEQALFGNSRQSNGAWQSLVPAAGAIASLWIYRRFGFQYAFAAAMIFAAFLPHYWTASHEGQRLLLAGFYAAGLATVAVVRLGHRFDFLNEEYSAVEALLWVGIYLTVNLQLSSPNLLTYWRGGLSNAISSATEFARPFYWATYALIWCLPAVMLWRALRLKDGWLTGLGAILSLLTLITIKPYLGLPPHPWDPMLLGILLIGVAIVVRRWLAKGPSGVRARLTARRLSGRDKEWMSALSAASGTVLPNPVAAHPPAAESSPAFGGGTSGGGGASSDF